jgi:hypothetical protein
MFPKNRFFLFRINILTDYLSLFVLLIIILFIVVLWFIRNNRWLTFTILELLFQLLGEKHLIPLKLLFLSQLVIFYFLLVIRIFVVSHHQQVTFLLLLLSSVQVIRVAVFRWLLGLKICFWQSLPRK